MKLSLSTDELFHYLSGQLNNFFPDKKRLDYRIFKKNEKEILEVLENCFKKVKNKYFFNGKDIFFNHLNTDQYAMFLYMTNKVMYRKENDLSTCEKIYYLNKSLHGIDVFYEVELPDIFLFMHPLGTVLGRAKYSDYFVVCQNCCVGNNHNNYPVLGENLVMHPGSTILGNSKIGNNCRIGANSFLLDFELGDNEIYIGNPKNNLILENNMTKDYWL